MEFQTALDTLLSLTSTFSLDESVRYFSEIRTTLEIQIQRNRVDSRGIDSEANAYGERELARLLLDHYRIFGSTAHLEECISIYQKLICDFDSVRVLPLLLDDLEKLGDALCARYELLSEITDLDDAVVLYEHALQLRKEHNMETELALCGLGIICSVRYCALADMGHCSRAKDLLLQVLPTSNELLRLRALVHLAFAEASLGTHSGNFLRAIQHASESLKLGTWDHPDHVIACVAAVTATGMYSRTELEPFSLYTYKLCTALGHPYLAKAGQRYYYAVFCNAHRHTRAFIEENIAGFRNLWQRFPSPTLTGYFGMALGEAFQATGSLAYLDEQIVANKHGVQGMLRRTSFINNLAVSLYHRYNATGQVKDLYESIHLIEILSDVDDPLQKLGLATNLAHFLLARFRKTGARVDLLRALALADSAITKLSDIPNHSQETIASAAEAVSVYQFACEHGVAVDGYLREAEAMLRLILSSIKSSEPWVYILLNALATCLHLKSSLLNDAEVIREAISLRKHALTLLEQDQHRYLEYVAYLASDYARLGVLAHSREDIEQASSYFSAIVQSSFLPPLARLSYAITWCDAVADIDEVMAHIAFNNAISLLPRAITFGGDFQARLDVLKKAPRLSTDAAMHAVGASRATEAIQLLEQGRAVLWTQLLSSQGKLHGLPEELGKQLIETHRTLNLNASSLGRRQSLMTELDRLVGEVRQMPGLENFLRAASYSTLNSAGMHGPLVVLISNKKAAVALVMESSSIQPLPVPLDGVNSPILQKMVSTLNNEISLRRDGIPHTGSGRKMVHAPRKSSHQSGYDILDWLWNLIVKPVINALRIQIPTSSEQRPRLHWCPTGPFAFLPLHAAGIYRGRNRQCTSDYIISSYTPTITALLNAQRDPPSHPIGDVNSSFLLAAIPNAPGHAPITNTLAEARLVLDIVSGAHALTGDVTSKQFLAKMSSASFLHLACHGKQAAEDPLESGFVFHDGIVKMSTLLDVKVPDACFAFLSACESAMGDKDLPDENIHLAATMLFIGYRSVVGTLWSMHDADGPTVASRVYSELAKNTRGFDYDAVPRALDAAMRELRDAGVPPSRWATWIHMGI